jgi:hypothetical protein
VKLHKKELPHKVEALFFDVLKRPFIPVAGVEPARSCDHRILSPARLPIPPHRQYFMEAATGIEPVVKVLQTLALPLGYAALK